MDYRTIDPPDDRFVELVRYAFSAENGPFDPDEFDPEDAPDAVGGQRGVFDDEDALAVCAHYWFDVDVRGESVSAPGLSAVATPPECRRDGNVRRLLAESLAEYRDRGDAFSVLWPFSAPFYAQYGWATTNRYAVHDVPPGALSVATDRVDDRGIDVAFERVDADHWHDLAAVDDAAWTQTLAIDRSEAFWRHRVFQSWGTDPYAAVGYRDGDPVAYLTYTVERDDDRRLSVSYFGATDHDALLALLSYCHSHDSQTSTVRLKTPVDWTLTPLLDDPGVVDTELRTGPMGRLVDARTTLQKVPVATPNASELTVVFDVDDPLVDWHDDPIRLVVDDTTEDPSPRVTQAPDATPDVELGVSALTQLLLGTRTATALARTGDLDATRATTESLDELYPQTDPCLLQFF